MVASCGQVDSVGPLNATVTALPTERPPPIRRRITGHPSGEDPVAAQIGFRRALFVGGAMWATYCLIDLAVIRYLHAGSLVHFLGLRLVVLSAIVGGLYRLHRKPTPSRQLLTAIDLFIYTSAAVAVALMCVEFRGSRESLLAGRLSGAPLAHRHGAGPVEAGTRDDRDPRHRVLRRPDRIRARSRRAIAAQLHDPAALTTLLVGVVVCALGAGLPRGRRPHRLGPSQAGLRGAQPRALPPEASTRRRRHGRRMGRVPPRPQARRGGEDSASRAAGAIRQRARALRARGPRHRGARAPQHRPRLRLRRDRGRALVLRHGAPPGRDPRRARRRASDRSRRRGPFTSSGKRRARSARRTSAGSFTATSSRRTSFSRRSAASTTS